MFTAKIVGSILMLCLISSLSAEINKDVQEACGKENDVDPAKAFEIIKSDEPIPEAVMCYSKCYMDKTDMLNIDETMNPEKGFDIMFPDSEDKDLKKKFEGVVAECNGNFNKETCELAGNMYRCIQAKMTA